MAQEHGIAYFETSAKENINVKEVMEHIMRVVYEKLYLQDEGIQQRESIVIGGGNKENNGNVASLTDTWSECKC